MNLTTGPRRTLRMRIVATTTLVSALAMSVMVLAMVLVLNHLTDHNIRAGLDEQLGAVTATLRFSPSGQVRELDGPDGAIDETSWVFDGSGRQVVAPRSGPSEAATAQSLASSRHRVSFERSDRVYLAAPVTDEATGRVGAVVVASVSKKPYEASRTAVIAGGGALGLVATAGAAGVAAWTTRRALGQVQAMGALAEDWSEHDLESRFATTGDDEIAHLGHTLNLLLDRVAGAIRREQLLTSELAHELRTPLAAIRGEAEVAQMVSPDPRLARVVELTERMNDTIRALLAIARGHEHERSRTDVAAALAGAVADLPANALDLRVEPTMLTVAAPLDLAIRALAPLTANAVEHAASAVTVAARAEGRLVHIDVTDDGPGLDGSRPADDLFTAGVRRSESSGAGLGLALSRRVARTLGGDVVITSTARPTVFTLTLHRF